MRQAQVIGVLLSAAVVLSACEKSGEAEVNRAMRDLNVIDESNLNDVMLNAADPAESVTYFTRAVSIEPERIDLQRGLGAALVRADRPTEAVATWGSIYAHPEATEDDQIAYADALIRANQWGQAESVLTPFRRRLRPIAGTGLRR